MSLQVGILFSILSLISYYAMAADSGRPKPQQEKDVVMKCVYTVNTNAVVVDSLPTQNLGFKYTLQKNNSNHIAVDTYAMNEKSKPVKQIGHAELTSDGTESVPNILTSLFTLAEDSPFEFGMTVSATSSTQVSVLVNTVTTFSGETYTALNTQCHVLD